MYTSTLPKEKSMEAFIGILHHRHMSNLEEKKPYSDIFYQAISPARTLLPVICNNLHSIEKQVQRNGKGFSHYITLNGLRSQKNVAHIYSINAFFVDLDFHEVSDPKQQVAEALQKLRTLIEKKVVLRPTIITSTGRGLGLYYVLDHPIAAGASNSKNLREWHARLYKRILGVFEEHFKDAVDKKVTNLDRLCRLPGTINPKTGTTCELYADQPVFYSLGELSAFYEKKDDVKTAAKTVRYRYEKTISYAAVKESGFLMHRNRCLDKLRDDFISAGTTEGWRELYLFWKYNTLVQLTDAQTARETIQSLDEEFFDGEMAKEIPNIFRSVDQSGCYKISDSNLAEVFNLSGAEAQRVGLGCLSRENAREKAKALTKERRERRTAVIEEVLRDNPTMKRGSLLLLVNERLEAEGLKTIGRDTLFDTIREIEKTERMKSTTVHMQRKTETKKAVQEPILAEGKPVTEAKKIEGRKVVGFFVTVSSSSLYYSLQDITATYRHTLSSVALLFVEKLVEELGGDQTSLVQGFTYGRCLEGIRKFFAHMETTPKSYNLTMLCKAILYAASYTEGYGIGEDLMDKASAFRNIFDMIALAHIGIRLYIGGVQVPYRVIQSGLDWKPEHKTSAPINANAPVTAPIQKATWQDEQMMKPEYLGDKLERVDLGTLSPSYSDRTDSRRWNLSKEELKVVRDFMWSVSYAHPRTQDAIVSAFETACDEHKGAITFDVLDQVTLRKYGKSLKELRLPEYKTSEAQKKAFKRITLRKETFWNKLLANHRGDEQKAQKSFFELRWTLRKAVDSPVPDISPLDLLTELTWEVEYEDIMAAAHNGITDGNGLAVYLHECVAKRKSA